MHLRLHYPDNRDYATDKLFQNAEFLRIPTNGNGGCAIHSAFGNTLDEYDQLILLSCREFLHEQLGPTATECERRVDDTFLFSAWVENDVWKDTIVPLIKHRLKGNLKQQLANVEPERRALWNAIERDAQVYATLQNLVEAEQEQEEAIRESRRHMGERPDKESKALWRKYNLHLHRLCEQRRVRRLRCFSGKDSYEEKRFKL